MFKVISIIAVVLALLVALGYFFVTSGGKPIGTDLSQIGQGGKASIVLAYENFSPTGGDALNRLRKVRGDFDSRLNFAVADLGTPQGQDFANRYQLGDGMAVFLNIAGEPVLVTRIAEDEQELRRLLNANLEATQ